MKFVKQTKFWQLPLSLKLVVIWVFLLSLFNFWTAVDSLISTFSIKINSVVAGVVYFYLAIDLAERGNISRILTSVVIIAGTLVRLILLALLIFGIVDSGYVEYGVTKYPITINQAIFFIVLNILLNLSILYTLLKPTTKAYFTYSSSETAPRENM